MLVLVLGKCWLLGIVVVVLKVRNAWNVMRLICVFDALILCIIFLLNPAFSNVHPHTILTNYLVNAIKYVLQALTQPKPHQPAPNAHPNALPAIPPLPASHVPHLTTYSNPLSPASQNAQTVTSPTNIFTNVRNVPILVTNAYQIDNVQVVCLGFLIKNCIHVLVDAVGDIMGDWKVECVRNVI